MKKSHHSYFPLLCIMLSALWFVPNRAEAQYLNPARAELLETLTPDQLDSLLIANMDNNDPNCICTAGGVTKAEYTIFELLYDMQFKQPIRYFWLTAEEAMRLDASDATRRRMAAECEERTKTYQAWLKKMHKQLKRHRLDWDDYSIEGVTVKPIHNADGLKLYTLNATILFNGKVIRMTVHDALFNNGRCQYFKAIEIE